MSYPLPYPRLSACSLIHALTLRLHLGSGAYIPEQLPEQGPVCVVQPMNKRNHRCGKWLSRDRLVHALTAHTHRDLCIVFALMFILMPQSCALSARLHASACYATDWFLYSVFGFHMLRLHSISVIVA